MGLPGTRCLADDSLSWVIGNRVTGCGPIVGSDLLIDGDIWLVDGPHTSMADATRARSMISACPKDDPSDKEVEGNPAQ